MFTRRFKTLRSAFLILGAIVLSVLLATGERAVQKAEARPIIKNQVEDLDILISSIIGGKANVLTIVDMSAPMGITSAFDQVGNWDEADVFQTCLELFDDPGDLSQRAQLTHCVENLSNTSFCGSRICEGGACDTVPELEAQIDCVVAAGAPEDDVELAVDSFVAGRCGGITVDDCSGVQMAELAQLIEAQAGLTMCSREENCNPGGGLFAGCDTPDDVDRFRACANDQTEFVRQNVLENCTPDVPECDGAIRFGSSRLDMALNVFFNVLDADNSMDSVFCADPALLYDGVNSVITCKQFMGTPYRDVQDIVDGKGPTSVLPDVTEDGTPIDGKKLLIDELTDTDAVSLGIRVRPMAFSGRGSFNGCTGNKTFTLPQGGFAGASSLDFRQHWNFYNDFLAGGHTPLAFAIGLDDNAATSSIINKDALNGFLTELQTDPAAECRPEIAIIITSGEDDCAGDLNRDPHIITNANRRSAIQAVSNLRTYFARNPVANQGRSIKKEIIVFVIGVGIDNIETARMLHAMALTGGTHTTGMIQHLDPNGDLVPGIDMDAERLIPNKPGFEIYKDLARVEGIDGDPNSAHITGCGTNPTEREATGGSCTFKGQSLFDDKFFNNGNPFKPENKELSDFAFIANNAEQLETALKTIFGFARGFSTSGAAPAAPQSSTSVALRDRIFLSLLTPITSDRLWQGRLALYSFITVPGTAGTKLIVTEDFTPPSDTSTDPLADLLAFSIFDQDTGTLDPLKAPKFHWEAGKHLDERSLLSAAAPRRLYTVLPGDASETGFEERATDGTLFTTVTKADRKPFSRIRSGNTGPDDPFLFTTDLPISMFNITDADVLPIPELCTGVCPGDVGQVCEPDAMGNVTADCKACVKECLLNRTVSFLSGRTGIRPVKDPMGIIGAPTGDCPSTDIIGGEIIETGSFENCEVRLGDIFHSTPKVVGSPSPLFFDTGFQNFAKNFRTRSGVVYAGANDGFLHAFHAGEFINASPDNPEPNPLTKKDETVPFFDIGTGEELFAFASPSFIFNARETDSGIPTESGFFPDYRFGDFKQFVLGEASLQRSWMDGSALVADIFIDGYPNGITDANSEVPCTTGTIGDPDGKIDICGKEWHTLLMMTPRNGGGVINVLDITNPDETNRTGDPLNNPDSLKFKTGTDSIPYPQHLWSMFDKNFGNMWADPVVGRVKMQTRKGGDVIFVDRWVVFVAGGLDPLEVDPLQVVNTNIGNAFYAIDIATGKIIYKVSAPPPTGVETNATETHDAMVCDLPGTVGAFDVNGDGYIDLVYTGDRCGRLWRFDVSMPFFDKGTNIALTGIDDNPDFSTIDSGGQSVWTASVAFCANVDANCNPADTPPFFPDNVNNQQVHKIFFAPTAVIDDLGRRHIIFVTGDRREPSNLSDEGVLVSFIDPYIPNVLSGSVVQTSFPATLDFDDFAASLIIDLTDQGAAADPDTRQFTNDGLSSTDGEFIVRFPNNSDPKTATQPEDRGGEKGFGSPVVINRVLIWTTFAPGALDNPCEEVSGKGRIFAIDYLTGEPALSRVPGATSMLEGSDDEIKLASGRDVAEGMPTPAQLSFGTRGSVVLVVAFSGSASKGSSQFLVWELPPFPTRTQTLFWEEVF